MTPQQLRKYQPLTLDHQITGKLNNSKDSLIIEDGSVTYTFGHNSPNVSKQSKYPYKQRENCGLVNTKD